MAKHAFALVDDYFQDFRSHHIRVKVASSAWERQGYFHLRRETFAREQNILPEHDEIDAQDFQAIAIIALASSWSIGDEVVGAVRIYRDLSQSDENTWYGGRLCVSRAYRGHRGIGKALINEAVARAKDLGCQRFLANVQAQNATYFESLHWQSLNTLELAGRPHVHMQAQLKAYPFMPRDRA